MKHIANIKWQHILCNHLCCLIYTIIILIAMPICREGSLKQVTMSCEGYFSTFTQIIVEEIKFQLNINGIVLCLFYF
jgi:hypothetical protein